MKANILIKEWGLADAKSIINSDEGLEEFKVHFDGDHWKNPSVVIVKDLKQLIESHELVESNGGYNSVKAMFEDLHCMDLEDWNNDLELLARAMSDVESCQ